ncbi:hypothetical protein MTO96_000294 [Rhipicephalus appendiculatus]
MQCCESDDDSHMHESQSLWGKRGQQDRKRISNPHGRQRRQPSRQPKCRYGRKCYRRDAQHLKHFRHPKLSYYEASLRDEGENRHEDESKDRADGRTITAELQENVIDIEVNGKWDHYDKPVCRFGTACLNRKWPPPEELQPPTHNK